MANAGPDGKFLTGDEPAAYPKLHSNNVVGKLTYQATQKYAVNIAAVVGGNSAYVGFTAGSGVLTAYQDIKSWTYTGR